MKTIGNILWFLLAGLWFAIIYFLLGILWCITIIGIPFGKQSFKIARLMIWPFGTVIHSDFGRHPFANIIWLILGGLELAVGFMVAGLILCLTIVLIPFGKQCFKLAQLSAAPFGATF